MDIKTKVATEIALKTFEQVKSSEKWDDLIGDATDWDEIDKLTDALDLNELTESFTIDQNSLDNLIDSMNENINAELDRLQQNNILF